MRSAAPDVLGAIVGAARRITEVRRARVREEVVEAAAFARTRPRGAFTAAFAGRAPRIIAECKRRSPSRGVLRRDYDPVAIASGYERAGAAAISVLTEPTFFDGAPEHLQAVRDAVTLPILRKDFLVERYQVLEARAWGADAVLLIAGALTDGELKSLLADAAAIGVDALVEVHDSTELLRAIDAGAGIIGVNNRNLRTLSVVPETAAVMIDLVPEHVIAIAESGLKTRDDVERLSAAGYDGFLIGERLMTAPDPHAALAAFA